MSSMSGNKVGEAYIELHYKLDQLARDLKVAQAAVGNQVDSLKRTVDDRSAGMFGTVNTALENIQGKLGIVSGLAVTAFAVQGARAVASFALGIAEAGTKLDMMRAKLTQVSGSSGTFDLAVASANKLGLSIETVAETMQRFGMAGRDIGLTTAEVQKLTEVVIQLGRISGASSGELSAGMFQLSQSLAAGRLNGDELRSVMEQIPEVARTIAAALGKSTGELRDMGAAGTLTADVVAKALLGAADDVGKRFGELPETLEQSQARWENAGLMVMASLDKALHASEFYKFVVGGAATFLEGLAAKLGGGNTEGALQQELARAKNRELLGLGWMGASSADVEQQLGEERLKSFQPEEPAPFIDIKTGKPAEGERTPQQKKQDQANLDASIKLKQNIADREKAIQQEALRDELDAFEEGERKKKAAADKAASERQAAARRAQSDAEGLIKQGMSAADTYAATIDRLNASLRSGYISQADFNKAAAGAKTVLDEANAAAQRKADADAEREAQEARRAVRDRERAQEKLRRDREERDAAEARMMDQWKEQDPRGYFQATEDPELARVYDLQSGVEGAFKDMQDSALEFGRIGAQAVTGMADIASSAITDWVTGSEMDLDRLAKALQQQVIAQFISMAIRGGIGALGGAMFGGGGGGTNTIETSYTGGKGYGRGYNGDYSGYRRGGVFDHGGVTPLARGGVVDKSQLVPLKRGAALIGEAGPEGVLPLRRNSKGQLGVMHDGGGGGGGGGGSTFIMNDQRGTGAPPIETRERRGPDGGRIIEATVRDTVRRQTSRGDHDQTNQERYGIRPQPVK